MQAKVSPSWGLLQPGGWLSGPPGLLLGLHSPDAALQGVLWPKRKEGWRCAPGRMQSSGLTAKGGYKFTQGVARSYRTLKPDPEVICPSSLPHPAPWHVDERMSLLSLPRPQPKFWCRGPGGYRLPLQNHRVLPVE